MAIQTAPLHCARVFVPGQIQKSMLSKGEARYDEKVAEMEALKVGSAAPARLPHVPAPDAGRRPRSAAWPS